LAAGPYRQTIIYRGYPQKIIPGFFCGSRGFVQSAKRRKKTGEKPRKKGKYSLTNGFGDVRMVFHTVIVCPFVAIPSNMVILSQDGKVVKKKVIEI